MEGKLELSIEEIQKIALDIYKVVAEICEQYDLKIFLTGGSVLGAIRHQGFIPWDDDMDAALPRADYDKFALIASEKLPEHLKIVWMKRPHHYRVVDTRYELQLNEVFAQHINKGEKAYVAIDIQPFDGATKSKLGCWLHSSNVFFNRVSYKMCSPEKIYINPDRKKWEAILITLLKKVSFLFSKEEVMQNRFEQMIRKYDYSSSNYIADYVGKYNYRDTYPKEWWEPGVITKFEDIEVRIPSEYDKYLSRIYGDYMIIPSEEKRIIHRVDSK